MQTWTKQPTGPASELRVGEFLPETLRVSAMDTHVVVLVHSPECPDCRRYLKQLGVIADEFRVWDARLVVSAAADAGAAVFIADRYGQVFYAFYAGTGHELPGVAVIAEALKFLGTLCPE